MKKKIVSNCLTIITASVLMCCGARAMAGQALPTDPVPIDQVPGAGVAGTVIVDDTDPSVVRVPAGKSQKIVPPPENDPCFGGTGLLYNPSKPVGDGNTTLTVSPALPAGRYAVWVRFVRSARNFHASAPKAVIQLHDTTGVWDYEANPRQGGQWVLLGIHKLSGSGVVLSFSNKDIIAGAIFDAAVFVPAGPAAPKAPRYLPPAGDEFATIIRRSAEKSIGPTDTPPADPVVAQRLRARDFEARLAWDTLIRGDNPTHLWGDCLQTSSWLLSMEAVRLKAMAAAWAGASELDDMGLRGNPKLLADTLTALDTFLSHRWTPTTRWDVNWFDFEIGVPRAITEALCILGPNVTPELKAKAFASMEHFTVDPWKYYNKGFMSTGANRVWMVLQHIRRAALAGDAKGLERCRDGLPSVMAFVDQDPSKKAKKRDGWWRDGSFIQHENLPYVGAYGCLLIPDLVECIGLLEGTPWELKAPERENMSRWVGDHLLPVAYEGELFPRTTGRTAGSIGIETSSQWLAIALSEMRPLVSKEQAAQITATLRRWIESGSLDPKLERADFAQFLRLHAIATDKTLKPAGPYIASRTHAAVDFAVHHRPTWAASVAMSSTRIYSHESLWGFNWRGWNQGEGMLNVYAGDPARYREGFWAIVDPYRLPGITTSTWSLPDADGAGGLSGKPTKEDFVGGASLDDLASVAAMRVGRDYSTLDARKGWFFLPDAIVCLGSGITATDGQPCETIVENCRIEKLDLPLAVDGKPVPAGVWKEDLAGIRTLHLGGMTPEQAIGWWFPPSSMSLTGERGERTGSWRNAAKGESDLPITRPWLSLILKHGTDPKDASYQYAILPGVSAERLKSFAAKPTIEILACTPQVQAVRDKANGIEGYIFFEPGTAGSITVDQPCVVVMHESRDGLSLAVADPTQKLAALSLTLKSNPTGKMTADDGVKVGTGAPERVDFDLTNANGSARTVRWNK